MNSPRDIHVGLLAASLEGGGAERMMVQLANALSREKVCVTLFVVNKKGSYLKEVSNTVQIVDLQATRGVKSVIFKIRKMMKAAHAPDVLISTQPHINTIAGAAGIGLSARPLLVFREANTPAAKYSDYGSLSRAAYRIGGKLADHYVAVSDGVKESMIRFYKLDPSAVTRIYNPLIDKSIQEKASEPVDHHWINEPEIPVIISMSRVVPQKDHETLIRAFSDLKKKKEARLLILGSTHQDPEYTARIRRLIDALDLKDSVELAGFKSNPFNYLSRASLFVLSSRFEGLPGSLVQAMACGCPVVSTDCPSGPAEILEHGRYGELVPVGNANKLAEAMYSSLSHPIEKKLLMKRAGEFSVERSAEQYLNLIYSLLNQKNQ